MDKVAILAAPTSKPSVALPQRSGLPSTLRPVLRLALRVQLVVSTVTALFFTRFFAASTVTLAALLFATKVLLVHGYALALWTGLQLAVAARGLAMMAWNSKSVRRLRKKLEYEFFVLILGPGGNALFLMIFWPGWLIAAAALWTLWSWTG